MRRPLTALFAALEAVLVVGIGVGIPLAPLTLMWAVQYGLQLDWVVFWRAAIDSWLLGHGVDIVFSLDPTVAGATGIAGAATPFAVTIAPLAFAMITALLGARAGRRIGETPHRLLGLGVAIAVFAVLSLAATLSVLTPEAHPTVWQGALLPTLVFALGVAVGSEISRRRTADGRSAEVRADAGFLASRVAPGSTAGRSIAAAAIALRGGAIVTALVLTAASVAVAVLLATHYGKVIALYEGVHAGVLGGAAITVGQLAFLPNLVVYAASWFAGPGFAIGTGSLVSPLGTGLGPIPALPIFGALPTADLDGGFLGLLVPVVAGFLVGAVLRRRIVAAGITGYGWLAGTGALMGVAAGVLLGALAWMSSGAAGPGRLVDIGPSWLAVGAVTVLEVGLPAAIALLVGGRSDGRADRDEGAGRDGRDERDARDSDARSGPESASRDQGRDIRPADDDDDTGPLPTVTGPAPGGARTTDGEPAPR